MCTKWIKQIPAGDESGKTNKRAETGRMGQGRFAIAYRDQDGCRDP